MELLDAVNSHPTLIITPATTPVTGSGIQGCTLLPSLQRYKCLAILIKRKKWINYPSM